MKLYPIEAGHLKLDGGAMFGVVPKTIWSKVYPAGDDNLCSWAMRCLLVVDGFRRILIDNGIGDKQDEKFFRNYLEGSPTLETSLAAHGYTTDDITDMVLTHLHFDHGGGSIRFEEGSRRPVPAFRNATYWISSPQWEWATRPNRREKASFLPENILPLKESGRLNLVEEEGEILPGIAVRFYHGHTEGQMIPHIRYHDKTIVFMADLLPSAAHIPLPWIMAFDTRPLITLEEKERFFEEALQNEYILFFEHDFYHECCTLMDTEKGPRVRETFRLSDLPG